MLGVSHQSVESHCAFAAEEKLPFSLLADTDGAIAKAYGVGSIFGFDSRVTFLIDGAGTIRRVWTGVSPKHHAAELLEALRALPPDHH